MMLALRFLPYLALALACWWLVDLVQDRTQLQGELAAAQIEITTARIAQEQALESARVHRVYLARAADQARQWDVLFNDLQSMEGRDAPLSPLLRAAAERLWP
ncbi:hypothetical protein FEE96_06170 [Parasedimentitalea maritima]|uniref:Uncharacterized protein n=1 Tax=Parasedimentitalea maritima TaxID=2578117 RepID=A0ABY2UYX8_9RHOB|nr:hypothetical protein [Zongyanglinia marina]TLP68096.1 hypothetical protein FEE96_06170 [Zongyanglinia marina]